MKNSCSWGNGVDTVMYIVGTPIVPHYTRHLPFLGACGALGAHAALAAHAAWVACAMMVACSRRH